MSTISLEIVWTDHGFRRVEDCAPDWERVVWHDGHYHSVRQVWVCEDVQYGSGKGFSGTAISGDVMAGGAPGLDAPGTDMVGDPFTATLRPVPVSELIAGTPSGGWASTGASVTGNGLSGGLTGGLTGGLSGSGAGSSGAGSSGGLSGLTASVTPPSLPGQPGGILPPFFQDDVVGTPGEQTEVASGLVPPSPPPDIPDMSAVPLGAPGLSLVFALSTLVLVRRLRRGG